MRFEVFTGVKIEAAGTFETLALIYQAIRRHIVEDSECNFIFGIKLQVISKQITKLLQLLLYCARGM